MFGRGDTGKYSNTRFFIFLLYFPPAGMSLSAAPMAPPRGDNLAFLFAFLKAHKGDLTIKNLSIRRSAHGVYKLTHIDAIRTNMKLHKDFKDLQFGSAQIEEYIASIWSKLPAELVERMNAESREARAELEKRITAWKWPNGKTAKKTLAPLPEDWQSIKASDTNRQFYFNKGLMVGVDAKPFKVEMVDGVPVPSGGLLLLEKKEKTKRTDKGKNKIVL